MNNIENQNLLYRIIEYGAKNNIIVKQKMIEDLQISDIDEQYIERVLETLHPDNVNPNHVLVRVSDSASPNNKRDWQFRILPNAIFQYNDYLEIKAARENAEFAKASSINANMNSIRAHKIAMWAIYISVTLGLSQIILQYYLDSCN